MNKQLSTTSCIMIMIMYVTELRLTQSQIPSLVSIYIHISRLIKQFKMNIFASLLSNSILNTQIQYLTYYVNSIVNPFPLGKQQFSRKSLENANFWFAEGG